MRQISVTCVIALSFVVAQPALFTVELVADEPAAVRSREAVDYPLSLIAFASIDRIRARAESLGQVVGLHADDLLAGISEGDPIAELLNCPGIDTTKPLGLMSYPVQSAEEDRFQIFDDELTLESFQQNPFDFAGSWLEKKFTENATIAICIPAKDRNLLLSSIPKLIDPGATLSPLPTKHGWYRVENDDHLQLGFVGSYLVVLENSGDSKQFDRNYPEFDKLAKSSLGKSEFVYSIYRRGLPEFLRDGVIPAFKAAFAARFQQHDDEPEAQFRLRTMFGALQMDLVDVVLSQVEEVRITGHVDNATRTIFIEPEFVGARDGKFARFCSALTPAANPFLGLADDTAAVAASLAVPLPSKYWKPVSEALYLFGSSIEQPDSRDLVRKFARTVESGQLACYLMLPEWQGDGLLALRVAGGDSFPDLFQQWLANISNALPFELAVDSVEDIPIHRSRTTISPSEKVSPIEALWKLLVGRNDSLPTLNEPNESMEGEVEITRVEVGKDGTQKVVSEKSKFVVPAAKDSLWIAATPQTIWLGLSSGQTENCPDWFKTQILASLAKPPSSSSALRGKSAFQLALRGLGATAPSEEPESPLGKDDPKKQQARTRGDLLKNLPNAIRCDVQSTPTGLKMSLRFEEAYFHWFATMLQQSHQTER